MPTIGEPTRNPGGYSPLPTFAPLPSVVLPPGSTSDGSTSDDSTSSGPQDSQSAKQPADEPADEPTQPAAQPTGGGQD